jgi:hypothetical protein
MRLASQTPLPLAQAGCWWERLPAAREWATAGRLSRRRASPPEAGKSARGGQVWKGVTPRRDRSIDSRE